MPNQYAQRFAMAQRLMGGMPRVQPPPEFRPPSTQPPQPPPLRADGSAKGDGYFGPLKRPDGAMSTELSIGVSFDGREVELPLLVPTLTQQEVEYLLAEEPGVRPVPQSIADKAIQYAIERMRSGRSPFAQPGEMRHQPR